MDGRIDYEHYSHSELLEALAHIDRDSYPENFRRLEAALSKHRAAAQAASVKPTPESPEALGIPAVSQPDAISVRLSPGHGPLGWIEPARNSFHLVGSGSLWIGQDSIGISGRKLLLILGLPVMRRIDLERRYISNVEVVSNAVRLEYRAPNTATKALTVWLNNAAMAVKVAAELPGEHTTDFRPQLQNEIDYEERLQSRSQYAPVTTVLVVLNLLVFVAGVLSGDFSLFTPSGSAYLAWGSNFGPYTTSGDWWRLLTGAFLHLGVFHVLFNMWALASFGPITERILGSASFAIVYGFSGLAAGCTSIAWQPEINSVGASGALFGVLGALAAALATGNQGITPTLSNALRNSTLIFTVYGLCIGFLVTGIDNAAHVGGLVCGSVLGLAHSVSCRRAGYWPAFMATTALGALVAGAATALALARADVLEGESLYLHTQHWLVRNESMVVDRQTILWKQVRAGQISDGAFADAIESDVLPTWREAERRLQAIGLPPESALRENLSYLRELAKSRRTAYELCVLAARTQNSTTLDQCTSELRRGDGLVKTKLADQTAQRTRAQPEP